MAFSAFRYSRSSNVIFQEKFGQGEPSDEMIDNMKKEMDKFSFDRIVAFGGGTIVDICKILALDVPPQSYISVLQSCMETVESVLRDLGMNPDHYIWDGKSY